MADRNLSINETDIVVFDLETTGFSPRSGDEIIEIGAVKARGAEKTAEFHSMINPLRPISPGASEVNGITNGMVRDAPLVEDVLPRFLDFIGDCPVVAHNANFDLPFVAWKIAEMGLSKKNNIVFDTLLISRRLFPQHRNHKLSDLAYRFKAMTPGHRAVSDAETTFTVFRRMVEIIGAKDGNSLDAVLKVQGATVLWPDFQLQSFNETAMSHTDIEIRKAIEARINIVIEYTSNGEKSATKREIKPIRLIKRGERLYLAAFCMLRGEQRMFRTDRIDSIFVQSE